MLRLGCITVMLFLCFQSQAQTTYNTRKVHFRLAFPYVNNFSVMAADTVRSNSGFMGWGAGIDYGDSLRTTELRVGFTLDFFAPMGPVTIHGPYTISSGAHVNLTRNRFFHLQSSKPFLKRFKKVELGYGIHGARYRWKRFNTFVTPSLQSSDYNYALGVSGLANVYTGKRFYLGLMYQPSLFIVNPRQVFEYQHLFTFEFGWRF